MRNLVCPQSCQTRFCSYPSLLGGDRAHLVNAAEPGGGDQVSASQGIADIVEPICVFQREIRRPAICALDQIDLNLDAGLSPFEAVLDAGVSRLRPVAMAAFTTVLGMTPLVFDIFWRGMAVTIMAGLTFATVLTLVVVPVLYAVFYRVYSPERERSS